MKFLGVLLAIFAVSCVRANPEECTKERGEACIDNLSTAILYYGVEDEEDLCRELLSSVDCLKEAVEDCLGEGDSVTDGVFEELDKLFSSCKPYPQGDNDNDEEMAEIQKCYKQNEDYRIWIEECIYEGKQQALILGIERDVDERTMKCAMHYSISSCFANRVLEKCGEEAAIMARNELWQNKIAEGCDPFMLQRLLLSIHHLIGKEKRK